MISGHPKTFRIEIDKKIGFHCGIMANSPQGLDADELNRRSLAELHNFYNAACTVVFAYVTPVDHTLRLAATTYREDLPAPETPTEAVKSVKNLFHAAMRQWDNDELYYSATMKLVNAIRISDEVLAKNATTESPFISLLPK
jgi:hypothetical protein